MRPRDTARVCDTFVTVATIFKLASLTAAMVIWKASIVSSEQELLRVMLPPILIEITCLPRSSSSGPYSDLTSNVKNLKTDEKTSSQL